MWSKNFWKRASERAFVAGAAALASVWTLGDMESLQAGLIVAAGTVAFTLITAMASIKVKDPESASLVE